MARSRWPAGCAGAFDDVDFSRTSAGEMKTPRSNAMYSEAMTTSNIAMGKHRRARGAMTLVEVMVVGTLASLLLGSAVAFLVQLQKWDYRLRDNGVKVDQSVRLAEAIRSD